MKARASTGAHGSKGKFSLSRLFVALATAAALSTGSLVGPAAANNDDAHHERDDLVEQQMSDAVVRDLRRGDTGNPPPVGRNVEVGQVVETEQIAGWEPGEK